MSEIYDPLEVIKEKLSKMRITKVSQFGYLDVAKTKMYSKHGSVDYYSMSEYNPFSENKSVNFIKNVSPISEAKKHYNKKYDIVDFGRIPDYITARTFINTWVPAIRSSGIFVITDTIIDGFSRLAIDEYVRLIGEDFFDVEEFPINSKEIMYIVKVL